MLRQLLDFAAGQCDQLTRLVLPPIADRNASDSGTDLVGYLTQSQGFSSFVLDDGAVYHSYSSGARGVEFLMSYYAILDRTPNGRDEGDAFQVWIRPRRVLSTVQEGRGPAGK